jgi:hypothetical protein
MTRAPPGPAGAGTARGGLGALGNSNQAANSRDPLFNNKFITPMIANERYTSVHRKVLLDMAFSSR